MIRKIPTQWGDDTYSTCVVAGDFIFLAHHGGGQEVNDIAHQVKATFESMIKTLSTAGATLDDIVQLNFYIRNTADFSKGVEIFKEYFKNGAPTRTTVVTEFLGESCLCQMDGIAYKPIRTV